MAAPQYDRRLSLEDLYTLPDDGRHYELQAGFLVSEPRPGFRHGRVLLQVGELLSAHVKKQRLGVVVAGDSGFVLARRPDTLRGPDVAFVSKSRFEKSGDAIGWFEGAPDLAVEVLSPSNTADGVRSKVADYLAAGARCVWVVDTGARTVTVYPSLLAPFVVGEKDVLDGGDVLPGFSVRVGEIFEV